MGLSTTSKWLQIDQDSEDKVIPENTDQNVDTYIKKNSMPLQWRHNEHDGVSNHQSHDCLLNRLFGHTWKKTSKLRVTGLCNAEKVSFDDVIMSL